MFGKILMFDFIKRLFIKRWVSYITFDAQETFNAVTLRYTLHEPYDGDTVYTEYYRTEDQRMYIVRVWARNEIEAQHKAILECRQLEFDRLGEELIKQETKIVHLQEVNPGRRFKIFK
jgi:hypothetical protein